MVIEADGDLARERGRFFTNEVCDALWKLGKGVKVRRCDWEQMSNTSWLSTVLMVSMKSVCFSDAHCC